TVSRTGLANGQYDAIVTLRSATANVASVQLPVTLFVGTGQSANETVFVLVVDETTFANKGQTSTNAAASYAWSLPDVAVGRYYLAAGTDGNGDGTIGDQGELFGFWPSNDSPQVLVIDGSTQVLPNLNFTLQLQSVQQSVGSPRLPPPIALRR